MRSLLLLLSATTADAFSSVITSSPPSAPLTTRLLVGNTEGNNVVEYDAQTGAFVGEFIPPSSTAANGDVCAIDAPDTLLIGPDGALYLSSGTTPENSAVYRFDVESGECLGIFAQGSGMFRPYGLAFSPDNAYLYVASFKSDQLLRFDGITGDFVDVYAEGTVEADGLNGPNILAFGPDGKLYVTTQGSYSVNGTLEYAFESQVIVYDLSSNDNSASVFIPQPEPINGYISLLGIEFTPNCYDGSGGSCDVFVSDFAGGIRQYDATGTFKGLWETPANYNMGSLSLTPSGELFSVGFDGSNGNIGAAFRYNWISGEPYPLPGLDGATFVAPTAELQRCVGVLALPRP